MGGISAIIYICGYNAKAGQSGMCVWGVCVVRVRVYRSLEIQHRISRSKVSLALSPVVHVHVHIAVLLHVVALVVALVLLDVSK